MLQCTPVGGNSVAGFAAAHDTSPFCASWQHGNPGGDTDGLCAALIVSQRGKHGGAQRGAISGRTLIRDIDPDMQLASDGLLGAILRDPVVSQQNHAPDCIREYHAQRVIRARKPAEIILAALDCCNSAPCDPHAHGASSRRSTSPSWYRMIGCVCRQRSVRIGVTRDASPGTSGSGCRTITSSCTCSVPRRQVTAIRPSVH